MIKLLLYSYIHILNWEVSFYFFIFLQTNDEGLTVSKAIKQVLHVSNPVFDLKNKSAKIEAVIKCLQEKVFVNRSKTS